MNEKIEEPSTTASARVHRTCKVIADSPDRANPASTTRRAAGVNGTTGVSFSRSALPSWAASSSSVGLRSARAASGRSASTAAARVRLKLAAMMLVARTPHSGRNTKPARKDPVTAPNRLMA